MGNNGRQDFPFLDGLRGLAALQVVFLHYFSAFLPVLASTGGPQHFPWESSLSNSVLSFVWDGYSAVYLFFLMSGFVLSQSFIESDLSIPRLIIKRFIRLFLPVATACLIAAALVSVIVHTRQAANATAMSAWLAGPYKNPMTWTSIGKDVVGSSMVLGYANVSLLQPLQDYVGAHFLSPSAFALNAPMWTLHGEFWGSLLILGMATLYKRLPPALFGASVLLVLELVGTSQLSLFVAGFLLYFARSWLLSRHGAIWLALSCVCLALGVWVCVHRDVPAVLRVDVWLVNETWLRAYSDAHFESSLGALLVFIGILINRPLRSAVSTRFFRWLGKLSFSVYLLHFPILFSLGCAVFAASQSIGYLPAVFTSIAVGMVATLIAATLFERYVDKTSIQLARKTRGLRFDVFRAPRPR